MGDGNIGSSVCSRRNGMLADITSSSTVGMVSAMCTGPVRKQESQCTVKPRDGTVPEMQPALFSRPSSAVKTNNPGQSEDSLYPRLDQLLSCPQWSAHGCKKPDLQAEPSAADVSKHQTTAPGTGNIPSLCPHEQVPPLECQGCQRGDYRSKELLLGLCSLLYLLSSFTRLRERKTGR